jgi:hypothetical protein
VAVIYTNGITGVTPGIVKGISSRPDTAYSNGLTVFGIRGKKPLMRLALSKLPWEDVTPMNDTPTSDCIIEVNTDTLKIPSPS